MFGSTIIEIVIALGFIYFLLSLVCLAVSEFIANGILDQRAKDLERGLQMLLGDAVLVRMFYEHPLIRPLTFNGKKPSYIPSRSFALALLDIVLGDMAGDADMGRIRKAIAHLPDDGATGGLRRVLLSLADEARHDVVRFRYGIGRWYDDTMDRVSGMYKQRVQWTVLVIAFLITVGGNVDTIGIARTIWNEPFLREALVDQARVLSMREAAAEQAASYARQPAVSQSPAPSPLYAPTPAAVDTGRPFNASQRPDTSGAATSNVIAPTPAPPAPTPALPSPTPGPFLLDSPTAPAVLAARERIEALAQSTDLPLGWSLDASGGSSRGVPGGLGGWLWKIFGLLLTALTVSLGAPFWFDVLNKFVVIRSTVKPREKSVEQPSKDRMASEDWEGGDTAARESAGRSAEAGGPARTQSQPPR